MSFKITGFDKLQKQLNEATQALQALDGRLAELHFDPHDPSSVESAIATAEQTINEKIAPFRGNPMVEQVAAGLKGKIRADVMERAGKARLT
jgi:hypothetical protein